MSELERQRHMMLANLLDTMRTFGEVRESAEVWEEDGLLCVYSGLPGAVFNSVLLTRPVDSEKELRLKLDLVHAMYRARRARWSLWLLEPLVPQVLLQRMKPIMEGYGAGALSRGVGMYAARLAEPVRELPQLEIHPVGPPGSRFDFCHVMAVSFHTPLATFLDVYNTPGYWDKKIRGFVGYSGNRAIATTCVMPSSGVMGLYGVSVLPEVRKRGIGERMVRYALQQVGGETGLSETTLESSAVAESLYRQMGYREIAGVSIYNESR